MNDYAMSYEEAAANGYAWSDDRPTDADLLFEERCMDRDDAQDYD